MWSAIGLGVLLTLGVAYAADRLDFPEDFGGPPIYIRDVVDTDSGWAAVLFLRDPDCAGDANLLEVNVAARNCALTSHGYVIRSLPPPNPPDVFHAAGNEDMPVWLLSTEDYEDAVDNGVLTVGELEGTSSLVKGVADQFVEHTELTNAGFTKINSHGTLDDGRKFKVKLSSAGGTETVKVD
ncbi:MAG: hypothetical protein ACYTDU_16115 [Planctomycetota bacterium]